MHKYRVEKWSSDEPPVASDLMAQMGSEGYDVFAWSDPPGALYPGHQHDDYQSHWIISGTLELTVAGVGTFEMQPGDRDFMPAGTVHAARVVGNDPVEYLIGSKPGPS